MIDVSALIAAEKSTTVHGKNAKRFAIVKAGVVTNVVMWDQTCCLACASWIPNPGEQAIQCDDTIGVASTYDGVKFAMAPAFPMKL